MSYSVVRTAIGLGLLMTAPDWSRAPAAVAT
jgi:hypothetical protein